MHKEAWGILSDIHADSLPVSVTAIVKNFGFGISSYQNSYNRILEHGYRKAMQNDAFSCCVVDSYMIFYNELLEDSVKRMAILHELFHLLHGHLTVKSSAFDGSNTLWNKQLEKEPNCIESAANDFALRLLAPACVIWALGIHSASEIEELCNIPKKSARQRAERMKDLYEREQQFFSSNGDSCFLKSESERKVYANFKEFIIHEKRK